MGERCLEAKEDAALKVPSWNRLMAWLREMEKLRVEVGARNRRVSVAESRVAGATSGRGATAPPAAVLAAGPSGYGSGRYHLRALLRE